MDSSKTCGDCVHFKACSQAYEVFGVEIEKFMKPCELFQKAIREEENKVQLLPCEKCGNKNITVKDFLPNPFTGTVMYQVFCSDCGSATRASLMKRVAVYEWNKANRAMRGRHDEHE